MTVGHQAEEINARLAPKWPRILREIRVGIFDDWWCEHLASTGNEPDGWERLLDCTAMIPGLDYHAAEVAYQLLLRSGRGTYRPRGAYKTDMFLNGLK